MPVTTHFYGAAKVRGGQGRGRTGDLPSFRWVRYLEIGLSHHAKSVAVSCESLTVRSSYGKTVHATVPL